MCAQWSDTTTLYYNITFNFAKTSTRNLLSADTSTLLPAGTPVLCTRYYGTLPLTGTFTISYLGITSQPQSIGVWYTGLEVALNELIPGLKSMLVLTGNSNSDITQLYFSLPYYLVNSSLSLFTVDISNVQGGGIEQSSTPNNVVLNSAILSQPGQDVYYPVIPSDFLRTFENNPQLTVDIGGVRAVCKGDCSFVYKKYPDYPQITTISSTSTVLTITGSLFDVTSGNTKVTIGYADCPITSITNTTILCTIPNTLPNVGVAGNYTPIV